VGGPRSDWGAAWRPAGASEVETLRRICGAPGTGEATGTPASTAAGARQGQQRLQSGMVLLKVELGGAGVW
jgi:hypothetical protein